MQVFCRRVLPEKERGGKISQGSREKRESATPPNFSRDDVDARARPEVNCEMSGAIKEEGVESYETRQA